MYGERNTNTNYLSKLIQLNLDCNEIYGTAPKIILNLQKCLPGKEWLRELYFKKTLSLNLGWKHSIPDISQLLVEQRNRDVAFVTITKNPYSWLLSLFDKPYHLYNYKPTDFQSFLNTPVQVLQRDNMKTQTATPIEMWNSKNASYLELNNKLPVFNTTTEAIFASPENVISLLADKFTIKKQQPEFRNYLNSTKKSNQSFNDYKDYYLNEKWQTKLTEENIVTINKNINEPLMKHFDYKLL